MGEDTTKAMRKYIFDYFLENSRAPVLEELMGRFGLDRAGAAEALEALETAHHVIRVPGTDRILMANPFSALATPFRVKVDSKAYFGACAWDSVAYHVMLGKDTEVDSYCHHCAEPIRIRLSGGRVSSSVPESPLVHLALPAARWWENIVITCANNMVFFSSQGHFDSWSAENPNPDGFVLSIDQTLKMSVPIYRDKLKLDYARPTKEELKSYWANMGLTGDFWRL